MEQWASKEDTINTLLGLGFTRIENSVLDSGYASSGTNRALITIYQCGLFYFCVAVNAEGWQAPVVWNGPRATWDDSNPTYEFVAYLNKHYPGWAG